MSEQHKETLSALFDGEASEFEMRRLLSTLDEQSCAQWQRFQLLRDAAKNRLGGCDLTISIADKVAARIALEPGLHVPAVAARKDGWLKPLLGFATAASIAFVAILGVQQTTNDTAVQSGAGFVANGNVSASQLPISGNGSLGLNTVSGSVQTSTLQREIEAIDAQKISDRARLEYYMQQHAQHASFNNGRGLLPMARITPEEK